MVADASELSLNVAGPRVWAEGEALIETLPCRECVEHGLLGWRGWHDVTNVNQLGKPLHDPENFERFKTEVEKAAAKAGVDPPVTGRNGFNTRSEKPRSESKMARDMRTAGAIYGGAVIEKLVDVGVKTTDATPITPTVRNSTIYNIVAAIVGAVPVLAGKGSSTVQEFGEAFSAAAVNNLIEDAAKAAGLPGATGVGAIRRIAPLAPIGPTGAITVPPVGPSGLSGQFGAAALF